MEKKTQEAVSVVVGMPLWALGRACDLAWFEFGSRRTVEGTKGVKEVGDYALHVQCAWRITQADKIVTGRGDIFRTPLETGKLTLPDFDWQQGNRFDEIAEQLFQKEPRQFQVKSLHAGEAGNLSLALDGDYKLQVMPETSGAGEQWRFFKPYSEQPHLVFSGDGLKLE